MRLHWKIVLSVIFFIVCVGPTIISYDLYSFTWDDSDYLGRSIVVSKAFWSADKHGLATAMPGIRPPMMTLLGLPWGKLGSWDAAGKCFVTLNVLTSLAAACCLFLLLRIGLKPLWLMIASFCLLAALGPFPAKTFTHDYATGFLADSLFAWTVFAAALLIPYETKTYGLSTKDSVLRGILWGAIFSAGVMTKASFLYFLVLIVPLLFLIRMRRSGLRSAVGAMAALGASCVPVAFYWLRYGLPALKNGWSASFGRDAPSFNYPLPRFLADTFRQSPGWLLFAACALGGIGYLLYKWRAVRRDVGVLVPLLIVLGYLVIGMASSNREIRLMFPGLIPVPFLIGLLLSGDGPSLPEGTASIAAVAAFCCLAAAGVPMLHRADEQSIRRSEEVVSQAIETNAKRIVVATDSASLNGNLLNIAVAISSRPSIRADSLAWSAGNPRPIEDDYRSMRESDLIVFQSSALQTEPLQNQRAVEYQQYIRELAGALPTKVVDGVSLYVMRRNSP